MENRIVSGWSVKPAGRPARPAGFAMLAAALLVAVPMQPVAASGDTTAESGQIAARPQWVIPGDSRAALRLIAMLQSSELDGLDPQQFKLKPLKAAVRSAARNNPAAMERANMMLDRALISYVTALRTSW